MKLLPRFASPAGFALVLLLFLVLPFLSVSCDVPGVGRLGADYTGAQLAVGAVPKVQVPKGLEGMTSALPGSGSSAQPPPDPGAEPFAIVLGVLLLVGIALPFLPRLGRRTRLFGGAGLAVSGAAMLVITQAVAQHNLGAELKSSAQGISGEEISPSDLDALGGQLIHTEIGFWLCLVLLLLIAMVGVGLAVMDRILPGPAPPPAPPPPSPPPSPPPRPDPEPEEDLTG